MLIDFKKGFSLTDINSSCNLNRKNIDHFEPNNSVKYKMHIVYKQHTILR